MRPIWNNTFLHQRPFCRVSRRDDPRAVWVEIVIFSGGCWQRSGCLGYARCIAHKAQPPETNLSSNSSILSTLPGEAKVSTFGFLRRSMKKGCRDS